MCVVCRCVFVVGCRALCVVRCLLVLVRCCVLLLGCCLLSVADSG